MNEAERCDRISLMHAGRVLVSDTPAALIDAARRAHTLEEAFIAYLEEATGESAGAASASAATPCAGPVAAIRLRHAARSGIGAAASTCAACSATPGARRWNCAATRSG